MSQREHYSARLKARIEELEKQLEEALGAISQSNVTPSAGQMEDIRRLEAENAKLRRSLTSYQQNYG